MARKSKGEKIRNKVGWIPRVITKKLNYAELENHMGILFKLHMHLNVLQNFTAIIALCAMMAVWLRKATKPNRTRFLKPHKLYISH